MVALSLSTSFGVAGKQEFNTAKLEVKSGNKVVQYNLAMYYQEGNGCKINQTLAKKYFVLSAAQGNSNAQYMLGNIYRKELNFKKAVEVYEKAAKQDHFWGQYYLGRMYFLGEGVKADSKMAFKWYSKAAHQGNPFAQSELSTMYREGNGVTKDLKQAFKWLQKSADYGNLSDQNRIAKIYHDGIQVPKDIDKAVLWYEKSALLITTIMWINILKNLAVLWAKNC